MKKIRVNIPGSIYPIFIGENIFSKLNLLIKKHSLQKNIFLVVDENVLSLYKTKINFFVSTWKHKIYVHKFFSNETNKSNKSIEIIHNELILNGFGRDTLLIAIGGGITGDLAGFAASTFARGVDIIHVPTTLLAMIDSSIGGKTGINFSNTKNIIGTFYQPKVVLIDSSFLHTLPQDEILCGIGEIIKYAFLIGEDYFNFVKKNLIGLIELNPKLISKVIYDCASFKSSIVAKDEKEKSGLRKILNLGHTFGHAIEVDQNYSIKHGEAVICGLACALHLSNQKKLLNDKILSHYLSLIIEFSRFIKIEKYNTKKLIDVMLRDKKSKDEKIKFVLPKMAGKILVDVGATKDEIQYSLKNGLDYFVY
ncbi:MAG: 3-dehydroquinate synthase [Ignavibacteria bacterium]|nr:3-dehydroquinate synthase [Ignavibacteria bacterium]